MNISPHDLRARLRDADPVAAEPAPSPGDLAGMRRTIVAATLPSAGAVRRSRPGATLALAAMLTIAAAAGVLSARRFAALRADDAQPGATFEASAASAARTQVHFSTPGGTRVIWTFDPAFQLRETRR